MPKKTAAQSEAEERAQFERLRAKFEPGAPAKVVGAATSRVVKSYAGQKVIVGSKLPMALTLFLEMKTTKQMKFQGSVWNEEFWVPIPNAPQLVISGYGYPIGAPPEGVIWPDKPQSHRGTAFTFDVDKDFWVAWEERHHSDLMVKNNLVAAFDSLADARAWAAEHEKETSGLGPMVRDTDKRWPKKVTAIEARKLADEPAEAAA